MNNQAKFFLNTKANNELQISNRTLYSGQQPHISFAQVVKYSSNSALAFFVVANVFTTYYIATSFPKDKSNQKYVYMAVALYLTQIIYNFLDINDRKNLNRLEMIAQAQES
jgi:hypothetical protein